MSEPQDAPTIAATLAPEKVMSKQRLRTNGQVERMNRTIKDATVKRYFYETHDQLRTHLRDIVDPTTSAGG